MKNIFTVFIAVCALSPIYAQQSTTASTPAATITTDVTSAVLPDNLLSLKETEFDFGKIPQGKPVTHIFEATNKSNVPLKIATVTASCGCTTPEWEKDKVIAPGEQTKITVGYNAAAEGPFTK